MTFTRLATVSGLVLASILVPQSASACGGCFAPSGTASQVTAHRMAVMISSESTTLWDQFEYEGQPEDFVWVLPLDGNEDVQIELSSNNFFTAMSSATAIQLQAPFRSSPSSGGGIGFGCSSADASPSLSPMSRVTVYGEEVVGPYETVTIGSDDPGALVTWLQDHGYGVPASIMPAIEHYVALGTNFVALRLAPGEGVDRMQPVRVTTPGVNVVFPLRMVGAGVSGSVALELFVIGEGRYSVANFDNLLVDRSAIVYDYATDTFDYDERAQALVDESYGGGWLTEAAIDVPISQLQQVYTTDGELLQATEDAAFVRAQLGSNAFITRMRADMPVDALRVDLILQASEEGVLPTFIQVQNDLNAPGSTASGLTEAGFPPPLLALGLLALGAVRLRRHWIRR